MFESQSPQTQQPPVNQQPASVPNFSPTPTAPTVSVGDIHTMPEKFLGAQAPRVLVRGGSSGGGKRVIVTVLVLLVLGGLGAGAYFYGAPLMDLLSGPAAPPAANTNQTPQPPTNQQPVQNTNQPPVSDPAARARDEQRVKDLLAISVALEEYRTQFNAYPQFLSVIPREMLAEVPADPLTGAPYTYTPVQNRQSYVIVFDVEEEVMYEGSIISKGSHEFLPAEATEPTNTNQSTPTSTPPDDTIQGTLDLDGDGLTAAEERLFTTSPNSVDTDADGYRDTIEISNFFSPVASGAIKLDAAGLVTPLTVAEGITTFYPTSWSANTSITNPNETLVTAPSGENFTITIADNPDGLTSWEWYVNNVSYDYNKQNVDIITIAGREAVRTLDGRSIYVAAGSRVISIVYNVGASGTVSFPNVFNLLVSRMTIL